MLNHIVIHGRVVRDPELRRTQSGVAIASFSVACDQDFVDKDGKRGTDFIDCLAWRQTGEFISQYFRKGQEILVSGRLTTESWTDKEGRKRTAQKVQVDRADFCGPKVAGNTDSSTPLRSAQNDSYGTRTAPAAGGDYAPLDGDDDECPF